jgi:PAS domain S-box-containing protein
MNFQQKILVIEDDQALGKTIQNILSFHGYDVCYTSNGASGVQKAFEYNPDVILCDVNMEPVDGYQVYNLLKESSLLDRIPFIFLTANSATEDIRHGLDLGADDYFVKPFESGNLIRSIENRLQKFRTIREGGIREFETLFQLSPNGIFIFNESKIIKANSALLNILNWNEKELGDLKIELILETDSIKEIKSWIKKYAVDHKDCFNNQVILTGRFGEKKKLNLMISEYAKYSDHILFIGIFSEIQQVNNHSVNDQLANEVYNLLKRERISITNSLGEKLTNIFKQRTVNYNIQKNSFFSKRENQVLCLSMEGLPIKVIADKLSISDRTVEKHRTKLMEKTGSKNIIEVIIFSLKNGLIDI